MLTTIRALTRTSGRRHPAVALTAMTATILLTPAAPALAWDFPEHQIAELASSQPSGTIGGQCKVWAEKMVNKALAKNGIKARVTGYGTPGGAYFGSYKRAGGTLVDRRYGLPGDLIQVISPEAMHSDDPPTRTKRGDSMLHSAIIISRLKPGLYRVRDSNYVAHETVGSHLWAPGTWRKRGVEVFVWRFGVSADADRAPHAEALAGARPVPPARA